MTGLDFIFLLNHYWLIYLLCLSLSFVLFLPILKFFRFQILDPYFINFILTIFANSVVIFLYSINEISLNDFIYFILAECLFWIGFLYNIKKEFKISNNFTITHEKSICGGLFYFFLVMFISMKAFTYLHFGIPLFLDSRLSLYAESGGYGVMGRILPMLNIYCLFYAMEQFIVLSAKKYSKYLFFLVIVIFIIDGILSGAKSGFLNVLYVLYFLSLKYKTITINMKDLILLFILTVIVGISGLILREMSLGESLGIFFYRFIASGDIYYYAYPDQMYRYIDIPNIYLYIISPLLVPARIIDPLPYSSIGFQMFTIVHPYYADALLGPNARMPILSFILFGWCGLIFSFLSGRFISLLRRFIKYSFYGNYLFYPIYVYIYINTCFLLYDFTAGVGQLFNVIMNITIFIFFAVLFSMVIFAGHHSKGHRGHRVA